ncbi:MAG: hypothetical protein E5X53_30560 [Mesorhizobium sp.]|uniref:hypothetical protein n=1 Tax=Mesorhizobium sp. TaxID=1871066 RepID=UPI00122054DB|nr:hypothetical protein [Mesorhizobium sp.]TIP69845.1 MAG: hypothetical protein E5X55_30455 [Mesorhizobium sp.]TIR48162.1 MAG: hypothetical protein E5X53_30560 [Mesorhizobium sp.]TJV93668.1 MAG: hypothetical protein E5X52_31220 [Mesorhizobium sp.]
MIGWMIPPFAKIEFCSWSAVVTPLLPSPLSPPISNPSVVVGELTLKPFYEPAYARVVTVEFNIENGQILLHTEHAYPPAGPLLSAVVPESKNSAIFPMSF